MEEPVRLICPECEAVYRVKNYVFGKEYKCRKCGSELETLSDIAMTCPSCGHTSLHDRVKSTSVPFCNQCGGTRVLRLAGDRSAARETGGDERGSASPPAEAPLRRAVSGGGGTKPIARKPAAEEEGKTNYSGVGSDVLLKRLGVLADTLAARLDTLSDAESRALREGLAEVDSRLETLAKKIGDNLDQHASAIAEGSRAFSEGLSGLSSRFDFETLGRLEERVRETGDLVLKRLDEDRERTAGEVESVFARKLPEVVSGSMEQALAKHAEDLSRVWAESGEPAVLADVQAVSGRIADEAAERFGERAAALVSEALAGAAPQLSSAIDDERLGETVMKSVREAQRPLVREVVNGRRGAPLWLFASLLLPLLLILGYLFADVIGVGGSESQFERLNETLAREISRLSATGVPLAGDDGQRLRAIEERTGNAENMMNSMYENAWAQVRNNGALEAEIGNMRNGLAERDKLISEYNASLERQSKRIRAYEIQLTRLGISPDSVPDSE